MRIKKTETFTLSQKMELCAKEWVEFCQVEKQRKEVSRKRILNGDHPCLGLNK